MKVVYWSSTGNTEQMAQMLGEELEKLGNNAEVAEVSAVSPADLEKAAALLRAGELVAVPTETVS